MNSNKQTQPWSYLKQQLHADFVWAQLAPTELLQIVPSLKFVHPPCIPHQQE